LDKNDFEAADDEKKSILELYRNDIGKYKEGAVAPLTNFVSFASAPYLL
jgi:hypothetical protein